MRASGPGQRSLPGDSSGGRGWSTTRTEAGIPVMAATRGATWKRIEPWPVHARRLPHPWQGRGNPVGLSSCEFHRVMILSSKPFV